MNWSQIAGYIMVGLSLFAAVVVWRRQSSKSQIRRRLYGQPTDTAEAAARQAASHNHGGWASALIDVLLLGGVAKMMYGNMVRRAGYFSPHAPAIFMLIQIGLIVSAVLASFSIPAAVWENIGTLTPSQVRVILAMIFFLIPYYILYRQVQTYRRTIEKDLPFWLDVHTSIVEGGVGFDEAVQLICTESEHLNRPIFRELEFAYKFISMGSTRIDALKGMAQRLDVDSLSGVVAAIAQGEMMGSGMVDTLRSQADMVRNKVAEEAENRAHRLPVELTFPMALGVLPGLFLVTIGPPVMKMVGFLGHMHGPRG